MARKKSQTYSSDRSTSRNSISSNFCHVLISRNWREATLSGPSIGPAFRHVKGLAFRLFRDASIRAAIMDARPKGLGGQTPEQYPVNVDPAKKSVPWTSVCSVPTKSAANLKNVPCPKLSFNSESPSIPKVLQYKKTTIRLSFLYYHGIHYLALLECICIGVAICRTSGIAL